VPERELATAGAAVTTLLALALATQAVTGVVMYVHLKVQQARRRTAGRQA
jgi:hypothetical protein